MHENYLRRPAVESLLLFVAALLNLVVLDALNLDFLVFRSVLSIEHSTPFETFGHLCLTAFLKKFLSCWQVITGKDAESIKI